jgi:2-methylisocitrate lyase-like PEP mutase family enzyme
MHFLKLHQQDTPLLLCNVWDVASTKIAEKLGFKAIGTSSAAIARSLGYDDRENMSFEELYYVVKRIVANTSLPLTVDIEAGYSKTPAQVYKHVVSLAQLGVVGINIEDSTFEETRCLTNKDEFARLVKGISTKLKSSQLDLFINVRIDTFIMGVDNTLQQSLERIKLYNQAGADGIFLPCITAESDISAVVEACELPVNVMCMPELPNFTRLQHLGVKRISMGNFIYDYMYKNLENNLISVVKQQSFDSLFSIEQ